jgi:acyl dehydratase
VSDQQITSAPAIPEIVFGPITRSTLALYAGASGDHNPVHIDSDYAKAAGFPDVFAQGMLSFGVLARVATQWPARKRLVSFGARFLSITQLGDVITCRGEIVEHFETNGEQQTRLKLTATAQDGRETLAGEAVVVLGAAA